MRKWLKRIAVVLGVVLLIFAGMLAWAETDTSVLTKRVNAPDREVVKAGWEGVPVDQKGRFMNDEFPLIIKPLRLLQWQTSRNQFAAEKADDIYHPNTADPTEFFNSDRDGMIWLGHATFLIRMYGVTMITDPTFYAPPLVESYVDLPSPVNSIKNIDLILLSHDHRDHMDEASIREITAKFPNAKFVAGMGSEELLRSFGSETNTVATTGWYQKFDLGASPVEITFVPVRHWSRRGLTDTNTRLWGGFVIRGGGKSIYFGGDSGYGRHYRETGEIFPNIDYFLIGIGAYEPRWFMEPNHNNPADTVKAFQDIGAKTLVPMHYGTFNLADEPPSQPLRLLTEEAERARISERVKVLDINEHIFFE